MSGFVGGCLLVLYTEMCVQEEGKCKLVKGGLVEQRQSQTLGLSVSI